MSENYIASFEVSAGASGGLGRKVHDVYIVDALNNRKRLLRQERVQLRS